MKLRCLRHTSLLLALTLGGSCAYYNSMYNANRLFADAEKAMARGEISTARQAYEQSIQRASTSVTRHPRSRWRDDARLLMARAHLQLGDPLAAQTRLLELLDDDPDAHRRAAATLYLGVIAAELGADVSALERLNTALADSRLDRTLRSTGLLARARLQARQQNWSALRADTRAVRQNGSDDSKAQAAFVDLRAALAMRDSAFAREAWNVLLREPAAQRWTDSLHNLARHASVTLSPRFAQNALAAAANAPWRAGARDSLLLLRAELILQSGDTTAAFRSAEQIAARSSGPLADAARIRAARWKLAQCARLEQLAAIRSDLLPALTDDRARALVQTIKVIDVLTERTRDTGQPLALFAAAELARDDLQAPKLAAHLFLTYAEIAPRTTWTPKALLAASALDPGNAHQLRERAGQDVQNPYVASLLGQADPVAFQAAEQRLAEALSGILAEASLTAARRESTVKRAVTVIDSLRVVARNDSLRIACGIMIDSLALRGIRADSVRAACQRGDKPRVTLLLKADTLLLRDSTKVKADSLARTRRIRRDTTRWQ
jgi:hypothetical protein